MAFRTALRRFLQNANSKTDYCLLYSRQWGKACQLDFKPPVRHSFAFFYASDASSQKFVDGEHDNTDASASAQTSSPASFQGLKQDVSGPNYSAMTQSESSTGDIVVEPKVIPSILAQAVSVDHHPEHSEKSTSSFRDVATEQLSEHGSNAGDVLENAALSISDLSPSLKPRVMPLPEDIIPKEAPIDDNKPTPKQKKEKLKKLFLFDQSAMEIPLPVLVPQESKKRKDPVALVDAIREIKASFGCAKFDQTVEAHVRLGVDPRRGDQMVRGAATLPHGTGKVVKVAVFAEGASAEEAKAAGADVVGAEDLVAQIFESGGKLNFDKCIATPALMPKLGKVARILGPRGLMPNPKVGTVTNNVGEAVRAAKRGRVDFKADKTGIVHAGLGKVSFTEEALKDNIAAFAGALLAAKPVGLKKSSRYAGYFNSFTLSSTMGPGVPVTIQSLALAADNYIKVMET